MAALRTANVAKYILGAIQIFAKGGFMLYQKGMMHFEGGSICLTLKGSTMPLEDI